MVAPIRYRDRLCTRHGSLAAAPRELLARHATGRDGGSLLRQRLGEAVAEEGELRVGRR